jgi:UrcA family protein
MFFRPIIAACLILGALAPPWAGTAQAAAPVVYTRHALKVDLHDLDLSRAADRHVLQGRIADAADQVCGGRPDKSDRYTAEELKLLVPAYEKCRTDAIRHAVTALGGAAGTRLADMGAGP